MLFLPFLSRNIKTLKRTSFTAKFRLRCSIDPKRYPLPKEIDGRLIMILNNQLGTGIPSHIDIQRNQLLQKFPALLPTPTKEPPTDLHKIFSVRLLESPPVVSTNILQSVTNRRSDVALNCPHLNHTNIKQNYILKNLLPPPLCCSTCNIIITVHRHSA